MERPEVKPNPPEWMLPHLTGEPGAERCRWCRARHPDPPPAEPETLPEGWMPPHPVVCPYCKGTEFRAGHGVWVCLTCTGPAGRLTYQPTKPPGWWPGKKVNAWK